MARAVHVYPICGAFNWLLRRDDSLLLDVHDRDGNGESGDGEPQSHVEMTDMSATLDYRSTCDPEDRLESISRQDSNVTATPKSRRDLKISSRTQHMVWFSGLRGAVAYACVLFFPVTFGHARTFIVTTMMVVLLSVFLLGGSTELVLQKLGIDSNVDEDAYMQNWDYDSSRKAHILLERLDSFCQRHFVRDDSLVMVHKEDADYYESETFQQQSSPGGSRSVSEGEELTSSSRKQSLFDYGKGE